jgi:lipoyl(octanoyl) transferase
MGVQIGIIGRIEYQEALDLQTKLSLLKQRKMIPDTLLLLEHPPVLTIGKSGSKANILVSGPMLESLSVPVFEINRGGDVTYHGPGQIVGYMIMDIQENSLGIKEMVWKIEEIFIRLLKDEYQIDAHREDGRYTGVWVGDQKITAIGIGVKHWVTTHGFAFNVNTNLEHFNWINPCGITDKGVTSLQKLLGHPLDLQAINEQVMKYFGEVFTLKTNLISKAELFHLQNLVL